MRFTIPTVFALVWGMFPTIALADSVEECEISNGIIMRCAGPYNGTAALRQNDSYQSCEVSNGMVMRCTPGL